MSRDDASGTVFPFVLGLALGAAVTVFFTPKAGEEARSDLAEVLSEAAKQVSATGKSIRRRGKVLVNLAKDQVQNAVEAGDEAYRQAKNS